MHFLSKQHISKNIFWLMLIPGMPACISTRTWNENQYLLKSQEIKGNKHIATELLLPFVRQKPNGYYLWIIPEVGIYQWGKSMHKPQKYQAKIDSINQRYTAKIEALVTLQDKARDDKLYQKIEAKIQKYATKKEKKINRRIVKRDKGNWLMRVMGKAPVWVDTAACRQTALNFAQFYRKRGYLNAKVHYTTQALPKKRMKVVYHIEENTPYKINDIFYESFCKDTALNQLVLSQAFLKESFIAKKRFFDEDSIAAERKRIEIALRSKGYFFFNQAFVRILADTTLKNEQKKSAHLVDIKFIINDEPDRPHKAYQIEEVYFYMDNITKENQNLIDTTNSKRLKVKHIHLYKQPRYSYKTIDTRLQVYPQKILNFQDILQTQQLLQTLDMFKFANIAIPDTSGNKAVLHIYTSPAERYQVSTEVGVNVGQTGIPGPFINFSLKNRNLFGTCEIFENSLQFMIDGQTGFGQGSEFYNSQIISLNTSLRYPTLFFPWLKVPTLNPRTKIGAGYSYVRRPEYTRINTNASMLYTLQYKLHSFNFTIADLNVINTQRIDANFENLINNLPNSQQIRQSFSQSLVSSIYLNYIYTDNSLRNRRSTSSIRFLAESGGTTLNFIPDAILRNNPTFLGLKVFQFFKLTGSYNYYERRILGMQDGLAFRIHTGVVRPYRFTATLPFEKFLFAGGSNSVRAWRPLSLGIGSRAAFDSVSQRPALAPGEILLEGNIEYRFPVYSFVKGALFLDAGNTWNFDRGLNDGSEFRLVSFYRQIALGTGFGLRFDLPFVLFRLDFGLKLYDPTLLREEAWVIKKVKPNLQAFNVNLGIGYPF